LRCSYRFSEAAPFLIDAQDHRSDAGPRAARDAALDGGTQPDAGECTDSTLALAVSGMNVGGTIDVAVEFVSEGSCAVGDGTCYYCIAPSSQVTLTANATTGSTFDQWQSDCMSRCIDGPQGNPCTFFMPGSNVGCQAQFVPNL